MLISEVVAEFEQRSAKERTKELNKVIKTHLIPLPGLRQT